VRRIRECFVTSQRVIRFILLAAPGLCLSVGLVCLMISSISPAPAWSLPVACLLLGVFLLMPGLYLLTRPDLLIAFVNVYLGRKNGPPRIRQTEWARLEDGQKLILTLLAVAGALVGVYLLFQASGPISDWIIGFLR
jgi:hypothetical protein